MKKIFSVLMSVIMVVFGWTSSLLPAAVNSVCKSLLGISMVEDEYSDGFLDTITDNRIVSLGNGVGYVKNMVLAFVDPESSVFERWSAFNGAGASAVGYFGLTELYVLYADAANYGETLEICEKLQESDTVTLAAPSYAVHYEEDYTPDDPFDYPNLWDEASPAGANWWLEAIDARNAWGYLPLMDEINVGIVDSGFDLDNEELAGKIYFPNKIQERSNVPDDHATHVAGIIAAEHNNKKGISGISPKARLCCVDWMPDNNQYWSSDVRILFSLGLTVKAGAKVVNYSLGASGSIDEDKTEGSKLYQRLEAACFSLSMASLLSKGYDFIAVQSAGNGNSGGHAVNAVTNGSFCSVTQDTAVTGLYMVSKQDILDRIIVVGNARNNGAGNYVQSSSSNVGSKVDICAPGSAVYSCANGEASYVYMSGTSMAAPVVTAVASLVWSVNPSLTGAQVKGIVCNKENTECTVVATPDKLFSNVDYMDYSLVNAQLAVEAAVRTLEGCGKIIGSVKAANGRGIPCTITAISGGKTFSFTVDGDGEFSFVLPAGKCSLSMDFFAEMPFTKELTLNENDVIDLSEEIAEFYGLSET